MKIFFIFILQLNFVFPKELILVQSLFRHGSRTPIKMYPNDIFNLTIWPIPLGQLLPLGMEQSFKQGIKLNQRYIQEYKFINATYNVNEIYVRSTDVDRTLQSAYYNLIGFYINHTTDNNMLTSLGFQNFNPIPVHTVPFDDDYLLNVNFSCYRKEIEFKKQLGRKEYHQYLISKQHIIKKIEKFSGLKIKNDKDLRDFYDIIYTQKYHNFSLPKWITKKLFKDIRDIRDKVWDYISGDGVFGVEENVELIKYNCGYLLNNIIKNMLKSINEYESNIKDRKKYYAFSAHDSTLASFLRTLGAKKKLLGTKQPDYSSVIAIELWKNDKNYTVTIVYSDNPDKPFRDITEYISDCIEEDNNICTLNKFIKRSEKYIINITEKNGQSILDSFKEFCQL
ncbi:Histidine phosphatase superfamily, clade-2-containing protein [Strongyloides ratti]|uniref:Histidine phosphatase superfamily, clade-2-containing protein n=1 Tax=Strongyloides ratti TaxID=34506 RepID=A0A090MWG5_STRRB|nr:Histidine phosphatase superfamily, clade-2-containing protein [Strongyloides ratti]CEF63709.1 Histidine phosphatase superfamily, clade-2-containing protein [Strongyloides ratti]